jgi:SpoVK/Ycf46/Vps4 family AAA+-type ATPase
VSSDVESTIVPQLLSEIDGVEELENVIVIGASNREDMIDPASCGRGGSRSRSRSRGRTPRRRGTSSAGI